MMTRRKGHRWPETVKIRLEVCPRCGENHGEVIYHRFDLGDPSFTHWAYCSSTGEPLLLNMRRSGQKRPDKFHVRFVDTGKKATQQPDSRFPRGVDISIPKEYVGKPSCKVQLPYPAVGIGAWKIECTQCGARVGCTAAGRPDDPRSIMIPCKGGGV